MRTGPLHPQQLTHGRVCWLVAKPSWAGFGQRWKGCLEAVVVCHVVTASGNLSTHTKHSHDRQVAGHNMAGCNNNVEMSAPGGARKPDSVAPRPWSALEPRRNQRCTDCVDPARWPLHLPPSAVVQQICTDARAFPKALYGAAQESHCGTVLWDWLRCVPRLPRSDQTITMLPLQVGLYAHRIWQRVLLRHNARERGLMGVR